jgi:hypothetical protein
MNLSCVKMLHVQADTMTMVTTVAIMHCAKIGVMLHVQLDRKEGDNMTTSLNNNDCDQSDGIARE